MLRLLFSPLIAATRRDRVSDLVDMSASVAAASRLLHSSSSSSGANSLEVARLAEDVTSGRRRLDRRLVTAENDSIDPGLLRDAATEIVQVVRLIARVIRCREWLQLSDTVEAVELQATACLGARRVAEGALNLAMTGVMSWPTAFDDSIKSKAEKMYNQGLGRAFEDCVDPIEVLQRRTLYDALLGVVLGSESALTALRYASDH